MNLSKRQQVFVSSTFIDLQEERREVIHVLQEIGCFPCAMELFPASSQSQWNLITRLIDECDYYMVIVAGRYGTPVKLGEGDIADLLPPLSYTEREFDYALAKGKPVLAFVHAKPGSLPKDLCEGDKEMQAKLDAFRAKVMDNRVVQFYDSPKDLAGKVGRSFISEIASNPQVGWVRGNTISKTSSLETIEKLRQKIERLEKELADAKAEIPGIDKEKIAQGHEWIEFPVSYADGGEWITVKASITWNDLLCELGPYLDAPRPEYSVSSHLGSRLGSYAGVGVNVHLAPRMLDTLLITLRAMGLLKKTVVRDGGGKIWQLTPMGDARLAEVMVVKRQPPIELPRMPFGFPGFPAGLLKSLSSESADKS